MFQALPNPRVVIASILHAQNATEILELLQWVTAKGLQLVIQPLYQNFGDVAFDPNWWKESEFWPHQDSQREELCAVLDALTTARLRGQPVCNTAPREPGDEVSFLNPDADSGLSCRAGHQDIISIDPQGNVWLCYFLEPVGSIFDGRPLAELWQARQTLRRRWEVSRCERHCNLLNCIFTDCLVFSGGSYSFVWGGPMWRHVRLCCPMPLSGFSINGHAVPSQPLCVTVIDLPHTTDQIYRQW